MLSPIFSAQLKLFAAIAASAMLISSPAAADWQYTRWGDAPEAVLNAAGGVARANDDRGKDPLCFGVQN